MQEDYVAERCDMVEFNRWRDFVSDKRHSPEEMEQYTGVDPAEVRAAARLYASVKNAAIYYGLGVTEHSQGSTMVMGMANLAMATGNVGHVGAGVNPLRGQNNVQGSCDMGSFPHELTGYRHVATDAVRHQFEAAWGVTLDPEPGLRIPNMLDAAVDGTFKGIYIQGEDIAQSDPNTKHVTAGLEAMECVVVQDIFLNETANYAHVFLPGTTVPGEGRHLHQCRAPHQHGAPGHSAGAGLCRLGSDHDAQQGAGLSDELQPPQSEIMDEIAHSPRPSRASPISGSTRWARSSGPATMPPPTARRPCISTSSCAARAAS